METFGIYGRVASAFPSSLCPQELLTHLQFISSQHSLISFIDVKMTSPPPNSDSTSQGHDSGGGRGRGRGRGRGSGGVGSHVIASRKSLPPPIGTRASNKTAHPGAIDAAIPRRSSEAVQAERAQKQLQQAHEEARKRAAISRVAALEDQMAAKDLARERHPCNPSTLREVPRRSARQLPVSDGPGSIEGERLTFPMSIDLPYLANYSGCG